MVRLLASNSLALYSTPACSYNIYIFSDTRSVHAVLEYKPRPLFEGGDYSVQHLQGQGYNLRAANKIGISYHKPSVVSTVFVAIVT